MTALSRVWQSSQFVDVVIRVAQNATALASTSRFAQSAPDTNAASSARMNARIIIMLIRSPKRASSVTTNAKSVAGQAQTIATIAKTSRSSMTACCRITITTQPSSIALPFVLLIIATRSSPKRMTSEPSPIALRQFLLTSDRLAFRFC
jgi:hypothetical protein